MRYFWRCLSAELLKTRRTLYLLGVIALPTVLSLLNFLLLAGLQERTGVYDFPGGWVAFEHNTITLGALIVFPSLVVLVTAFVAHQEHDTGAWRRLMCLPVPKASLYLAKLALVVGLMLASYLLIWLENVGWGTLHSLVRPEAGLALAHLTPWAMLVPYLFELTFLLLMVAVHFWFSMRAHNFVLSIGAGFGLVLLGAFLHDLAFWKLAFPWSLPSLVFTASGWQEDVIGVAYSLAGFLAISAAGCRNFVRRDVLA